MEYRKDKGGYFRDADGKRLHRKLCREYYGWFPSQYVVHHIDFNKENNNKVNLIALPRELHDSLHSYMNRTKIKLTREQTEQALKLYKSKSRFKGIKQIIEIKMICKKCGCNE